MKKTPILYWINFITTSKCNIMLKHNILLFFRNIKKYKSSFLINIIGLSAGLASALLIYLWVADELKIDQFHEKDSQLYQVMRNRNDNTSDINTKTSQSGLLAPALIDEFPEVEYAVPVRISNSGDDDGILSIGDKKIKAKGMIAGKDFFNVFSYPLIEGNKNKLLQGANDMVISDKLALKLFGTDKDILNKTIKFDNKKYDGEYNISGVFKKSGYRSSEDFDFLIINDKLLVSVADNWVSNNLNVYLILKENVDINQFNAKIKGFVRSKVQIDYEPEGIDWIGTLFLRPYSDKYLYGNYENGVQSGGRIDYVILFSIIGIIILIISCINFMNLATAKASSRMKEIGVKKVFGISRKTLIFQYLSESLLTALLSLPVAVLIVQLCLLPFNNITRKQLALSFDIDLILSFLGITILVGIISGSYPALYLSHFKPVVVLKGKITSHFGELIARKGLVIFQFMISFIFIVSVLVIYNQMNFLQSKHLGYNKENIINVKMEGKTMNKDLDVFLSGIKKIPGVINASDYSNDMIGNHGGTWGLSWEGKKDGQGIDFGILIAGYDFIETLGIKMAEGRSFSREYGSDAMRRPSTNKTDKNQVQNDSIRESNASSIIFNQAAITGMGLTNPIGQYVKAFGTEFKIVGVTENFHFESLYENIKPCFFILRPNNPNVMIKMMAGNEKETIARIEKYYLDYSQGIPFDFTFMDEDYEALYGAEQRVSTLSKYFALIAIIISCLGLFGLAAFTAEQRTKEIGIRKVLGASTIRLVNLLSMEFLKLVLIALLLAIPLSWYYLNEWLQDFAYRIDLSWSMFAISGFTTLIIAFLTISFRSIKTANSNPVNALRNE